MTPSPEAAPQPEVSAGLTPQEAEQFEEIAHAPELQDLEQLDQQQEKMAEAARAAIAAMPEAEEPLIDPEGYKKLSNEDLLGHYRTLEPAATKGNPAAISLREQYGKHLVEQGVDLAPPAVAQAEPSPVKTKRGFSLFRRG